MTELPDVDPVRANERQAAAPQGGEEPLRANALGKGPARMSRSAALSAFCMFLVLGALTASLGASLPSLREKFGSAHAVGNVVSFYNGGALVATVVIGLLGRRVRAVTTISALFVLIVLGTAGMAFSPSWGTYLSCTSLAGIGYGGMTLMLNTAFARGFLDDSVVMVNRLNAVFGIGAILGPLGAGAVGRVDIRLLALAACLLALVCVMVRRAGTVLDGAGPVHDLSDESLTHKRRQGGLLTRSLFPGTALLPFLAVGLVYAGTETSIGAWQSTQLVRSGWDTQAATTAASGFWAGMAIGRLIIPRLTRRVPPRVLLPLHLAAALAMLLLAALPHAALLAYPLAGLSLAPVLPTLIAWLSGAVRVPQRAISVLTLCCMLGNATVPAVVEALTDSTSASTIALALSGSCAICLACTLVLRRTTRTG